MATNTATVEPLTGMASAHAGAAPLRRVVQVLTSLEIGGAEMVALRLAEELGPLFDMQVITLRRRGPLAQRIEAAGVPVVSLDVPASAGALTLARELRRVLSRIRPHVIHSHNLSPLIASALANGVGPRADLVHTEHGRSSATSPAGRVALWFAGRRATTIVAVSSDAAEWAVRHERLPARRVRVVHNGIPVSHVALTRQIAAPRAITVARIEPIKDLETMVRATRQIVNAVPEFQLATYRGRQRTSRCSRAWSLR